MITTLTPEFAALSGGLLIARIVLGTAMAAHGAQKLFGWFGGHGLAGTGGFFESIGFRPGKLWLSTPALALSTIVVAAFAALGTLVLRRTPKAVPAS